MKPFESPAERQLEHTALSGIDAIDHEWLIKFLERRIGDPRILRLIRKWLRAGVSEDGEWSPTTVGTPQGAVGFALLCERRNRAPLLANVYLHYVFDLWIQWWRKSCRGDVVIVRYADDFVIGFENHNEATACLEALHTRFRSQQVDVGTNAAARPTAFASSPHHSSLSQPTFSRPTQGRIRMTQFVTYGSVRGRLATAVPTVMLIVCGFVTSCSAFPASVAYVRVEVERRTEKRTSDFHKVAPFSNNSPLCCWELH